MARHSRTNAESRQRVVHRSGIAAAVCIALAATCAAMADWPTSPGTPLTIGNLTGVGSDFATGTTPDAATWVAWVDGECFGTLKVQRISAGGTLLARDGLALFPDDGCTSRAARLAACADGSVIVSAVDGSQNGGGGPLVDSPIQRLAANGQSLWGSGLILPGGSGKVGQLLGAPNGDALVAWNQGANVYVSRYSPSGNPVWPAPAMIVSPTGSSMRIFGLVPDGSDGAFVFWDVPGPYTRAILAARVTSDGAAAWAQPLVVTPPVPASSRHTDPVAVAGSNGEAIVAWTDGAESSDTIVHARLQRISSAGEALLEPEGRRVSTAFTRQFDISVSRNAGTGDIYVAWRDGLVTQSLRSQRLSSLGERLWGDAGVLVTSLSSANGSYFDARWNANRLALSVVDVPAAPTDPRVHLHRVDAAGVVDALAWPVSGSITGRIVHVSPAPAASQALVITWFIDPPGFTDSVVAQRVNSDGTLGLQAGDTTGDGAVDVNDLLSIISHWGACPAPLSTCIGDIAPAPDGNGEVNINDLLRVITNWGG